MLRINCQPRWSDSTTTTFATGRPSQMDECHWKHFYRHGARVATVPTVKASIIWEGDTIRCRLMRHQNYLPIGTEFRLCRNRNRRAQFPSERIWQRRQYRCVHPEPLIPLPATERSVHKANFLKRWDPRLVTSVYFSGEARDRFHHGKYGLIRRCRH